MKEQPLPKGRFALKYRGTTCLNCGHELDISDRFCPNCSQINSTKRLELLDFLHELLSSIINYDSRLVRTLQALLLKPGKISQDYIAGMRVRYTNPFKFLLSVAIIYFLLIALTTDLRRFDKVSENFMEVDFDEGEFLEDPAILQIDDPSEMDSLGGNPGTPLRFSISNSKTGRRNTQDKPSGQTDTSMDATPAYPSTVTVIETPTKTPPIDTNTGNLRTQDSLILSNPRAYIAELEGIPSRMERLFKKVHFFRTTINADYVDTYEGAVDKFNLKDSDENLMSYRSAESLQRVIAQPSRFAADLISKLPLLVFFFIPLFTLFVHLVYIRKNYTYTEHLIFSFHNQSLLFILLVVSVGIDQLTGWSTTGAAILIFGIYLYKAMRKFYGQNRIKTLLKYTFLNTVFGFLALTSVLLLFLGRLLTY